MEEITVKGTWMEEEITVSLTDSGEVNMAIDKVYDHDISITKADAIKLANHILVLCK